MAEGQLTMFGKTYNTVGSADSNLLLQTRGDLKIRWGNKFIDLVKNGKINVDADILNKVDDKDSINKDGIYLIENGDTSEVWISIGGKLVNLVGEVGKTYVSFVEAQDVDADGRFMALSNAGFYYDTLEVAQSKNLTKGLVFIVSENQLYYVKDGQYLKYEPSVNIPNPLTIGNITIDGNTSSIQGSSELNINVGTTNYVSILKGEFHLNNDVVVHQSIESYDYVGQSKGYVIMETTDGDSYAEFDIIKIRKKLEYINREYYTYAQLKQKMESEDLIEGREYVITDFQNEWEITHPSQTFLTNDPSVIPNVWPIVIIAEDNKTFKPEGYFDGHPEWIIEYDINYYYYLRTDTITDENGNPRKDFIYTKGRITKMTDQNGNVCNYDFKHRKFKYSEYSDDKTLWYYTYNVNNPYYQSQQEVPFDKENKFLDATELEEISKYVNNLKNVKIVNNVLYIKEPDIKTITVQDSNGNNVQVKQAIIYDEYILFPNCITYFPYENQILDSSGTYIITYPFYKNIIGGLYQNVTDRETLPLNFDFYENTFDNIYIIGEYVEPIDGVINLPATSSKRVTFTTNKQFIQNTGKDITNATFKGHTRTNIFQDITNTFFEHDVENNEFGERLEDTHFYCTELKNNKFNGFIDTNYQIEDFTIDGIITNNTFNRIVKAKIKGIIKNSTFNDIKPDTGQVGCKLYGRIEECLFHDILGCDFKDTSEIVYVKFFDEMYQVYYDIESSTIEGSMYKVTFTDKVIYTDFKGIVRNTNFYKQVGLQEVDRITLNNIDGSNFYGAIKKLNANNSSITACTFNADINEATIIGTLNDCQFQALNGGIIIGEDGGSISNMTIQIDISPTSAQYAESAENSSILIEVNPFKITPTGIPRLALTAHKECFVQDKYYSGSNKKTFIVQLSSDDNTPSGVIVMFSGTVAQIPKGYAICDGTNGTPDLTGRFIRSVSKNLDNTFESTGEKNNTDLVQGDNGNNYLSGNKVPKHTHTFKSYNQTFYSDASALNINYVGSHSLQADLTGKSASVNYYLMDTNYGTSIGKFATSESGTSIGKYSSTATATLTGSAPVTGSLPAIEATGNISITISFTPEQDTESFPEKTNIEPQAYALIFIMKL